MVIVISKHVNVIDSKRNMSRSFLFAKFSDFLDFVYISPCCHRHCNMMAGNSNSNSCRDVAVLMLEEQLLELALNLTVHCCGLEFRVLNDYDQKSFDEERGLN
ncbi:hypothetical protein Tco_0252484 [Tanacetum coccineum]